MRRHLLMRLRAPLIAFGGETIDNFRVIRDFPALSMITGMIANAFGWDRSDFESHDRLQSRLVMGTRLNNAGMRIQDFQTAQLSKSDSGWTTRGEPEERRGGEDSYKSPHLRYRDYHVDLDAHIALRLEHAETSFSLDDIAHALDKPMRPLFIGRKPCLPSCRLFAGFIDAESVLHALQRAPLPTESNAELFRFQWPLGEGALPDSKTRSSDICDERNWKSGMHGGWRPVLEDSMKRPALEAPSSTSPELLS